MKCRCSCTIAIITDGVDGRSVKSITAYYAKNNSNTEAPTSGWSPSGISPDANNRFLWYKEATVYSDSSTPIYTTPVVIGVYGEKGLPGDSITITDKSVTYGNSDTGTTEPSSWSSSPSPTSGKYLWTKTYVKYSDDTENTSYSVAYIGTDGSAGKSIVVAPLSYTNGYWSSYTEEQIQTQITNKSSDSYTCTSTTGINIGDIALCKNKVKDTGRITYVMLQVTSKSSSAVAGTVIGQTSGTNGTNGTSPQLSSQKVEYQNSASGTTVPTDTTAWKSTATPTAGQYTWCRTTLTYSDDTNAYIYSVSYTAKDGEQGYSIVASVTRNAFTDSQWTGTYGVIGHVEEWGSTSSNRNGCRIGDLFTVVGTSTDGGKAYTLTYVSTTASGNLKGKCISCVYAAKGATGDVGNGIASVTQTTTSTADGGTNVITVKYTNGETKTFNVKNGSKGSSGKNAVNVMLSAYSFTLPCSDSGVIDGSGIVETVTVTQGTTTYTAVSPSATLSNNQYKLAVTADYIDNVNVDTTTPNYSVIKGSYDPAVTTADSSPSSMTADSALLTITVSYKDNEGVTGSVVKYVSVIRSVNTTVIAGLQKGIRDNANSIELSVFKAMVDASGNPITDKDGNQKVKTISGVEVGAIEGADGTEKGYIRLDAEQVIAKKSIKAAQISSEAITAEKLNASCISGKSFLVGDTTDSEGTKVLGSIRSSAYDENGENATKAKGFFLNSEGVLRATDATFNSVHITDGELASPSLQTSNASTQAAWCASPAFPDENGKSSSAIKVLKKETDTALTSVGTLTFTNSITGYWRASDFVTWLKNNIPVNNTAFTKLTGTFDGYNAYARRCDADTWTVVHSYSNKLTTISTTADYSFTIDCGLYYKNLKITAKHAGNTSILQLAVQVDGSLVGNTQNSISGTDSEVFSSYELSPGTHTVTIIYNNLITGMMSIQPLTINTLTSITSVYGVDAGGIELRLYSGTDDSIVFSGGTSDNRLNVVAVNEDTSSGSKTYRLWLDDSFASTYYKYIPVNLTYGSSTFKGGNGLTGWTTTRYEPFPGLYKIGQYNETSKEVEWASGTLSLRDSCVYKVSSVVVDGTLYQKDFNVSWNNSVLLLTSEDGQNSWSYTKDAYYSSFPCISYVEIGFAKGVYVFSLYPKVAKESDIGSSNQPFDSVYANHYYGVFPVGAVYISVDPTSPASLFGGEWVSLDGGTGGYTLWTTAWTETTTNNLATASKISAGLPNIKGWFALRPDEWKTVLQKDNTLYTLEYVSGDWSYAGNKGSGYSLEKITFNASGYNSIYSDSVTTVQPPSVPVYMWRRTK